MHPMITRPMERVTEGRGDPEDIAVLSAYIENLETSLARLTTPAELRAILREASEAEWKGEAVLESDLDEE